MCNLLKLFKLLNTVNELHGNGLNLTDMETATCLASFARTLDLPDL